MIDWITDPLAQRIVVRGIVELTLIGIVSGGLGCWIVLAGRSYSAESLAHAMLPGLVLASLLGIPLLLGGAAGLVVGAVLIALAGRVPRLDGDVAVSVDIAASPTRVWALLTDGAAVPSWNSTVSKLAGTIAAGERLAIEVPAAPGRTFRPRVVEFEADRRMVWADGFAPMFKGVRTFELEPLADGGTRFTMRERLGGVAGGRVPAQADAVNDSASRIPHDHLHRIGH